VGGGGGEKKKSGRKIGKHGLLRRLSIFALTQTEIDEGGKENEKTDGGSSERENLEH